MFAISTTAHVPDNATNEERWQEQTVLQFWESKKAGRERGREREANKNENKHQQIEAGLSTPNCSTGYKQIGRSLSEIYSSYQLALTFL